MEWKQGRYLITDDREKVQLNTVHQLLAGTYWGDRRSYDTVSRMVTGSVCFSLFDGSSQIGFGRAVTDRVTFSWLADIVIESKYRGQGLGRWLVACMISHPAIKDTPMALRTRDAKGLYEKFGFSIDQCLMGTQIAHGL